MITYVYVLIGLYFFSAVTFGGRGESDKFIEIVVRFFVILPLIGRVLGWW